MSDKKFYLIGFRYGATMPRELEFLVDGLSAGCADIIPIRTLQNGQWVVRMSADTAQGMASGHPQLIIEEDRELQLFSPIPGLAAVVPNDKPLVLSIQVSDAESGEPVPDATVFCVGNQVTYKGISNQKGLVEVRLFEELLSQVIISPRDTYWSHLLSEVTVKPGLQLKAELQRIPLKGKYTWGHAALGMPRLGDLLSGAGVKIAVIDSGIVRHADLATAGGYNTRNDQDASGWDQDENGHGTHCGGILAASSELLGVRGVSPGAHIYSLKVSPGGRFSHLLEAINWCIDNYIDVICIGLGTRTPSEQVAMALLEAIDRGITCVAAAGNDSRGVAYPAAHEHVIAVSAVGRKGTFPAESAHTRQVSDHVGRDGQTFFAGFSNFGPEICVCAPGVAIPATVPTGYAAWDGTSMACAFVSGLAALILEGYPEIRTADSRQSQYVREIICTAATDLGLPPEMQGAGLVHAERALASAIARRRRDDALRSAERKQLEELLGQARQCRDDLESALAGLNTV